MIEKKECIVCLNKVIIINCHYICNNCGFSENCHDFPHMINMKEELDANSDS